MPSMLSVSPGVPPSDFLKLQITGKLTGGEKASVDQRLIDREPSASMRKPGRVLKSAGEMVRMNIFFVSSTGTGKLFLFLLTRI